MYVNECESVNKKSSNVSKFNEALKLAFFGNNGTIDAYLNATIFHVGPHGEENLRQLEISGGTGKRQQTLALFRCFVDGMALKKSGQNCTKATYVI